MDARRCSLRAGWAALLLGAWFGAAGVGCGGPDLDWDGVVEIDYGERYVETQVKRRINLVSGGVVAGKGVAADSVWKAASGYTLIAYRPADLKAVRGLRVKRFGVAFDEDPVGIGGFGGRRLQDGFWLVDVFSTMDTYMGTAAVSRRLPDRRLLLHLGIAKEFVAQADRMHLEPQEQLYWRELLPEVVRNRGYGQLYLPRQTVEALEAGTLEPDSLEVKATRYILEEGADYIVAGQRLGARGYLHVFSAGHQYRTTLLFYGEPAPDLAQALAWLGWDATD